jgi:hypothetical protein
MLARQLSHSIFKISLPGRGPMKSCPQCNRTFEDTFTFCLIDGSILSAPFDPHAKRPHPEPRQTEPSLTEVLRPQEETKEEIPPTIASPQRGRRPEEQVSTIAAPAPAFESKVEAAPTQPALRTKRTVATGSANQSSLKYLLIVVAFLALLTVYTQATLFLLLALIVSGVAFLVYKKPTRNLNALGWTFVLVASLLMVFIIYKLIQDKRRMSQTSPSKVDVNITTPSKF